MTQFSPTPLSPLTATGWDPRPVPLVTWLSTMVLRRESTSLSWASFRATALLVLSMDAS